MEPAFLLCQDLLDCDQSLAAAFCNTRFLVLDEADRMLDSSFEPALRAVLAVMPAERQTLLFSATMTRSLIKLQQAALQEAFIYKASSMLYCMEAWL
jgi:ATP-dependent RNA helicase DDX49/DBP8